MVSDYERRWGVDRLPALVDPALRDRFWSQMDKLNAAIASNSPADVEAEVEVTLRGYAALEAKAREMGSKEIEGIAWTAPMEDGRVIAIVRDIHEIGVIKKDMPDAIVYSVQEVAAILAAWTDQQKDDAVNRVKDLFPGAHVTKVTELEQELDDEILSENKRPWSVMPMRALSDKQLKERELRVLGAVCSFTNRAGVCWPSLDTLCDVSGYKERKSVLDGMKRLKARKYVRQLNPKDYQETSSGWKTNRYQVLWDGDEPLPTYEEIHTAKPLQLRADQEDDASKDIGGLGDGNVLQGRAGFCAVSRLHSGCSAGDRAGAAVR